MYACSVCLKAAEELGAGLAAADLAGEALVQEALAQEQQLHSTPHHRATSPYKCVLRLVPCLFSIGRIAAIGILQGCASSW
jgi:hypothetical protein